jgi:hypothetical protein
MVIKKNFVIDELATDNGKKLTNGIYSFFPFENLDSNGNGIFKVGRTENYKKRIEAYHSDYPDFYITNLLQPNNAKREPKIKFLNKVESFVHTDLVKRGAKQIKTTTRIKKIDKDGRGQTEWFYTNQSTVADAFHDTQMKFGGGIINNHLNDIKRDTSKPDKKILYTGEIRFMQ